MNGKYLFIENQDLEIKDIQNLTRLEFTGGGVHWLHLSLERDDEYISGLTELGLDPQLIEDIRDLSQLPKIENYQDYIFMILEDIELSHEGRIKSRQLSLVLFKNILISVEEKPSQLFEDLCQSLRRKLAVFKLEADDIFVELVDFTVEDYFSVLEDIGEKIDDEEDLLLLNPERYLLSEIYSLKRSLISTRKTLWMMRNAINRLVRNEFPLISRSNNNYLRDSYDHLVQLVDLTETYRDVCSGMLEIYLSSISNKTNDIMMVLTIFSTIFIPLTFIAGVYGMNFKYLPEIHWKYGYLGFWVLSILITAYMIRFFKGKKWM